MIKVKKQYQVFNKYNIPTNTSSLNDYEINVNLNGTVQTLSSSYYKINMAKLPELTSYLTTISYEDIYYSGSVSFTPPVSGSPTSYTISSAHSLNGTILSGSVWGSTGNGVILSPGISITSDYVSAYPMIYTGVFGYSGGTYHFVGSIFGGVPSTLNLTKYNTTFLSSGTGPVTDDFKYRTLGAFFGSLASGINYRKTLSMLYYPKNAELLNGYFTNHHKYGKQQFSTKEINSYDNTNTRFKWKKNSQNKKTTVDVNTGLLDNSDPVETKTV